MSYEHLSEKERETIGQMVFAGQSFSEIARVLGRHKSTISREWRRNRVESGRSGGRRYRYYAGEASVKARHRRKHSKQLLPKVLDHRPLLKYVLRGLKKRWSPEQIAGRIRLDFQDDDSMRVSHETIYCWLREDKRQGGDTYRFLRQAKRFRRKKYGSSLKRYRIQNQTSIDQRPKVVEKRKRLGDWEGDTMQGMDRQTGLLTLVDRKSRFLLAAKVPGKYSKDVIGSLIGKLKKLPSSLRKTVTLDNGTEFTYFEWIEDRLGTKVYFAHPYSSWERGTNENTNGLLRQYFSRKTDFKQISAQQLASSVKQINNRPRKCLNWRTPQEAFLSS